MPCSPACLRCPWRSRVSRLARFRDLLFANSLRQRSAFSGNGHVAESLPERSSTIFSGLISLCRIPFICRYSSPTRMHAIKNFVCCSVNLRRLLTWYRRSPPLSKSITRYKFSRSWKAKIMLTINLEEVSKLLWSGWVMCAVRVLELGQEHSLIHHRFDAPLADNPIGKLAGNNWKSTWPSPSLSWHMVLDCASVKPSIPFSH